MTTTFLFEELDGPTREYLLAVRAGEGKGSPGAFVPVRNQWPTAGCVVGPILIITTLICTLSSGVGIVFDDPTRVALLQTAGLLLGGWMVAAAVRVWGRKASDTYAGHWAYADPLHLYVANGEQVKVTPLADVVRATCTHHLNENKYQHSAVEIRFPKKFLVPLALHNQSRAERLVEYVNYLAWCRGPDGGSRGDLPPAVLGGLARYVAKNGEEPVGPDGRLDTDLAGIDLADVPEDPQRDRRAIPRVLAYVIMIPLAVACVFVMAEVNVPFRDDAIYDAVTRHPMEPRYLRSYLIDPRNRLHRAEVADRLAPFYAPAIGMTQAEAKNPALRDGFVKVLESLQRADQPVVSLRVTEGKSPPGREATAADRARQLAEGLANRTNDEFARFAPPVQPPADTVFLEVPPPIGHQLIAFAGMPDDAQNPHFDISYEFVPENTAFKVTARVTIRVAADGNPVGSALGALPKLYTAGQLDEAVADLREQILRDMVGLRPNPVGNPVPQIQFPPIQFPQFPQFPQVPQQK